MDPVTALEALATEWHYGVERKGKGHIPYIEHPRAVVQQLHDWGMTDNCDQVALAVAWGHDLIEDTKVPASAIFNAGGRYGREILDGILWLTFNRNLFPFCQTHDDAYMLFLRHIGIGAPRDIFMVKLADRFCNTRDFLKDPPKDEPDKAARYLHEADPLLHFLPSTPTKYLENVEATFEQLKQMTNYNNWRCTDEN